MAYCITYHWAWISSPQGAFCDAMWVHYGWRVGDLLYYHQSALVARISQWNIHWACHYGGFPTIHNEVRNVTAHLMSDIEVCYNVGLEPILQPITNERLHHRTANTEDGACVEIKAQSGYRQCTFLMSVFNPLTQTYCSLLPSTLYWIHEQEKKRAYDQHFREVESMDVSHLSYFLPLVGWDPLPKWFTIS